ncbi:hypothetical protein OIU85_000121 [Salix viminalis]|uniref:DUF4220 domain-containing protein n=1 Tax=Salix viminalis TaxID=40686 RepID=A0A9Q0VIH4_SALVM|nr:hypothetical protein OIU85_000121 [Salix viminalis]
MFKIFYADLALSHSSHMASYRILTLPENTDTDRRARMPPCTYAFKVIEVELGFMYDVLFTKLTSVCSKRTILRSISFLSSASALVAFSLMIMNKSSYTETEVIISYILLGGGVVLEIYGVIMLLLSDWAMLRLSLVKTSLGPLLCFELSILTTTRGGKRYMAQHDLADATNNQRRFVDDGQKVVWYVNHQPKSVF